MAIFRERRQTIPRRGQPAGPVRLWAAVIAFLPAMVVPWVAALAQAAVPGQAYDVEILNAGNPTGLCLAINYANTGASTGFALLAPCHAYVDRSFVIVANKGALTLMALQNGVCLDRWGTKRTDGVPLAGSVCDSNDVSQQFHLTAIGGLLQWSDGSNVTCAHVPTPAQPQASQRITQGSCLFSSAASWRLDPVPTPKPASLQSRDGGCAYPVPDAAWIPVDDTCSYRWWDLPVDGWPYDSILSGDGYCITGSNNDGYAKREPCGVVSGQSWRIATGPKLSTNYQAMSNATAQPSQCIWNGGGLYFTACDSTQDYQYWRLVTG